MNKMFISQRSLQFKSVIAALCLGLLLWTPHIGLDYVLEAVDGQRYRFPHGQHFLFFSSLLASVYLFRLVRFDSFSVIFHSKALLAGMTLLLLGVALSTNGLWNWRLLAIVGSLCIFSTLAGNFAINSSARTKNLALLFVVLPFCIPVFGSILLELFGAINIGVTLSNAKHMQFSPPRWRFMNMSANGFGFDAALASIFFTLGIFYARNAILKITVGALLIGSLYALFMSGTRAAFIFYLAATLSFAVFRYGARVMLFLLFGAILVALAALWSDYFELVKGFLRLNGDLQQISSARWGGIIGMFELFTASPLRGMGFGAADNKFPIYPSNIFYFGLLAEIGIFGLLGALLIMAYPIKLGFASSQKLTLLKEMPLLVAFSGAVMIGFVPYLLFEFDVLRVSVNNQVYFFCWGVLVFHFINADTNSNYKNASQM